MKLLLTIFLIYACGQTDQNVSPAPTPKPEIVAPSTSFTPTQTDQFLLDQYMTEFKNAMDARGIEVDYSNVQVTITDTLDQSPYSGEAFYNPLLKKEMVTFHRGLITRRLVDHEMGHALWHLKHSPDPDDIMYYGIDPADLRVYDDQLDRMADQIRGVQ